ncbi:MAG: ATP-binding protein, partial [Candidatus Micrarchaeaceae archaeon]
MYIGSTGTKGFLHLLYEVLDNAIDEAQAGFAKNITIRLSREEDVDVAELSDDGRGIPVDTIKKEGKPALEVIMTSLHSGAKFDSKVYKVAGGLHGVGLTVVNSLSDYTDVTVRRDGKTYRQRFSRGAPISGLDVIGDAPQGESGTMIRFKPDTTIFSTRNFDSVTLIERLKELGYLNPGVRITLIDAREPGSEKETLFFSQKGIADFIDAVRDGKEAVIKPIMLGKQADTVKIEIAFQYVNTYSEELLAFVNKIRTADGGT